MIEPADNPTADNKDSRGPETDSGPRFLVIGRITKPHGIYGEVQVIIHTDMPERYEWLEEVYLGPPDSDPDGDPVAVDSVRFHKGRALLKLDGIPDRNAADTLRNLWVYVPVEDAIPLEDGGYFLYQVIGLSVITTGGEDLGKITDVIDTRANYVFVIHGERGEVLLPDIEDVIISVDIEAGIMTVDPLPGLL